MFIVFGVSTLGVIDLLQVFNANAVGAPLPNRFLGPDFNADATEFSSSNPGSGIQPDGTGGGDNVVFARFTLSGERAPTNVPEPGTLALFGIGLVGLGLMRQRRKKAA